MSVEGTMKEVLEPSEKEEKGMETQDAGKEPEVQLYETVMWAGRIPVYQCCTCKRQMDSEDDMILHVIKHLPKYKREKVFNQLVKEKE